MGGRHDDLSQPRARFGHGTRYRHAPQVSGVPCHGARLAVPLQPPATPVVHQRKLSVRRHQLQHPLGVEPISVHALMDAVRVQHHSICSPGKVRSTGWSEGGRPDSVRLLQVTGRGRKPWRRARKPGPPLFARRGMPSWHDAGRNPLVTSTTDVAEGPRAGVHPGGTHPSRCRGRRGRGRRAAPV